MTRHEVLLIVALAAVPAIWGCGDPGPDVGRTAQLGDTSVALDPQQAVEHVVAEFGSKMRTVSLLAPDSIASPQLQEAYGSLVTPELLADWMARPAAAPGRRVSSPWPDHIDVQSIEPAGPDEFDVVGEVVYVTSVEQSSGGRAAAEPARLHLRRGGDGSWRISAYAEGAAVSGA